MKKQLIFLVTFCLFCGIVSAQTNEEAAIKKVIEDEKAANDAADYETYKSYWVKAPYASFIYNDILLTGNALWKKMDEIWVGAKARNITNTRTDWNFRINGDAAFVTFNQRAESAEKQVRESSEARFMEKVGGQWKLVNVTAVTKPLKQ